MKAIVVAGARPNFMKVAPVLRMLEARGVDCSLVHTGQHYDDAMSDVFFRELDIRQPDVDLGVGSATHAEQTAEIMIRFESVVADWAPDVVVVVGDVNSTVACGLVAAKAGVFLAHVEAGLRSRDWDMPEEINRVVTDRLSDVLLASSPDAVTNLEAEGYRADQIHLVGNVMVDTLLANVERAKGGTTLDDLGVEAGEYGLVTLHRPSNVDDPEIFAGIWGALREVSERCPLVFPVHPRTRARVDEQPPVDNIALIDPTGYLDTIALQASARLVLTDSGGIQEETTVLGVPCVTIRESTERPITVTEGSNRVVGTDPALIVQTANEAIDGDFETRHPELWDGRAAERIADVLIALDSGHPRPTDVAGPHR